MRPKMISGDIVTILEHKSNTAKGYALFFEVEGQGYLLLKSGDIIEYSSLEPLNIKFVCHSGYVHSDLFNSLEEVKENFLAGKYNLIFQMKEVIKR